MINIVWIFGSSAAGKGTLIHRLLDNPPQTLLKQLNLRKQKIVCIEESLKYIGQFENDPITKKREEIIDKAKLLAKQSDILILIKGQDIDLELDLLNKLKQELPQANHQIIFLHADLEILYQRARQKDWWSEEDENEGIAGFKIRLVDEQIKPLQTLKGFTITAFDSTNYEYKQIQFPPTIK